MGAIYLFPKLNPMIFRIEDDTKLILDILQKQKILLVEGSAFNIKDKQHFRIVFLPDEELLSQAITQIKTVLDYYEQR
jgi:alanine-synthesizing transaminase